MYIIVSTPIHYQLMLSEIVLEFKEKEGGGERLKFNSAQLR